MSSKHTFTNNLFASTIFASTILLSQTLLLSNQAALAGDVKVGGQTAFTINSGSGSASAGQKTESVQQNLDNALVASQDRSPQSVGITYVKGVPVITLGGYQVVTIDNDTAQAAGVPAATLAQQWSNGLKQQLQNSGSVSSYVAQLTGGQGAGGASAAPSYTAQQSPVPFSSYNGAGNNAPPADNYGYQSANPPSTPGGYQMQNQTPPPNYGGAQGYGGPPQQGYGGPPQQGYGGPPQQGYGYGAPPGGYRQGQAVYAPAGLVIPIRLSTSISTQIAKAGDPIEAQVSEAVSLGNATIPPGSTVIGEITEAKASGRLERSGRLGIKFNRLRTPDGLETPIQAHLVGGIGKYKSAGNDTVKGEGMTAKVGQTAIRGGVGAGLGAALGTAVGAIAGGGHGVGTGAWSGAAIGGGLGVADSLLLRKGREVLVPSGTAMQIQLDQPATMGGGTMGNL
jgi:hypothetical protein